jgi:hypothetical protein
VDGPYTGSIGKPDCDVLIASLRSATRAPSGPRFPRAHVVDRTVKYLGT